MPRYQGFEVEDYVFTLDALPLKPSRFCNIGVNSVSSENKLFLEEHLCRFDLKLFNELGGQIIERFVQSAQFDN